MPGSTYTFPIYVYISSDRLLRRYKGCRNSLLYCPRLSKLYQINYIHYLYFSDLTETISYLTQQLKVRTVRAECLEDENDVLKKKSEQTQLDAQQNIQELNLVQKR